jgi:hypothetical protein
MGFSSWFQDCDFEELRGGGWCFGAGGNGQGSNPTESSKQGLTEGDMYGGGDRESEGEWMIKET